MAKRIGEILVDAGVVTEQQVNDALEVQTKQGGKLCRILIQLGHLSEEQLLDSLGSLPGVTSVSIEQYAIDSELRQYIPKAYAISHEIMPLDKLGRNLTVAMAVPLDEATKAELEEQTGLHIRAVLCGSGIVRRTIEQYYGPSDDDEAAPEAEAVAGEPAPPPAAVTPGPDAVRLDGVLGFIESVDQFPVLLDVHVRVMDLLDTPDASVAELTQLIEQDPTLSANLLRVANSAAYAPRSEFDSIQRTVAYLGLRTVRGIVTGVAVLDCLQATAYFDLSRLVQQAYASAVLTKLICDAGKLGHADVGFTAGLLAGIGHIAMHTLMHQRMEEVDSAAGATTTHAEAEEAAFGVSASEVGFHLAQHWHLPATLCDVIRFHDRWDRAPEVGTLTLAVALAHACMDHDDEHGAFDGLETNPRIAPLLERLGLGAEDVLGLQDRYYAGLETLASPGAA